MFLEVSDNPHLTTVFCLFGQMVDCVLSKSFLPQPGNNDCSDCKIIPSLWAQVGMEEAAYCVFDCVLPTTTTTTTKPHPTPFSLSPCGPRSLWQKQLVELIFKKKSRTTIFIITIILTIPILTIMRWLQNSWLPGSSEYNWPPGFPLNLSLPCGNYPNHYQMLQPSYC